MVCAGLVATACSSGSPGPLAADVSASSAPSSPGYVVESTPPGTPKDSVLDLNSTKDMTGVETTVTYNDSPYLDHFPDICTLIPDSLLPRLGAISKRRGFTGTQLQSQACSLLATRDQTGMSTGTITVNFFINNIQEQQDPETVTTIAKGVRVNEKITAVLTRLNPIRQGDTSNLTECQLTWGTFFGSIGVDYIAETPGQDPCQRATDVGRVIAPYMPKSPSQMRPAP
jgi:hypothetical protein